MRLWRIASAEHPALDGEGAGLWGGRWNSPGHPTIYASASASLAVLEKLVWIEPDNAPEDVRIFEIELRDDLAPPLTEVNRLPRGWKQVGSRACIEIGDDWLARGSSLALAVPSALLPQEIDVLIDPRHPQPRGVRVVEARQFVFDRRLLEYMSPDLPARRSCHRSLRPSM